MHILFIADNFPPEVNAPATRTYEHCKIWVDEGHKVTVLTCTPNFPRGKVFEGYENRLFQKEKLDGIEVVRLWSYITANEGFFKRSLDYFSFAFTSFLAGLFYKTDLILATSPQFFTTWSGWLLSKLKRKPWVFEIRDLWPESIKTVGAIKEGFLYKILERIELGLYRSADLIIPVTNAFKNNLIQRGINAEKQVVIPNGSNLELFDASIDGSRIRKMLGLGHKFIVGYIGTHGMAHSLDFILGSASFVEDKDIHFLFIGDGAEKKSLVKQAKDKELSNVTFLDPVSKDQVPQYLAAIDISLVPLKKADTFKTVIPSKIFEAAAMKTPIILGVEGEARELLNRYEIGISFEPENQKDFLKKLSILKNDNELYGRLLANCEKLAKDYHRQELGRRMMHQLKRIVKKKEIKQ